MMEVLDHSKNYTVKIVKFSEVKKIPKLDNLVSVNVFGNDCLISKDYDGSNLHMFIPSGSKVSKEFLGLNNMFRNSELNRDTTLSGYIDDNCRIKAIKFKGVISTGIVLPVTYLNDLIEENTVNKLKEGDEFNVIGGLVVCEKYIPKTGKSFKTHTGIKKKVPINSEYIPEHFDTLHLMNNVHNLKSSDIVAVTYKLHGTSARYFMAQETRKISYIKRLLYALIGKTINPIKWNFVSASRRMIKSIDHIELPGKNHWFNMDVWTYVGNVFKNKLYKGEAVYCEIIGVTPDNEYIQRGYSYNLTEPKPFIYRISNINDQGIEVDLSYPQMKIRAEQLGVECCPELFYGSLGNFLDLYRDRYERITEKNIYPILHRGFYTHLLDRPSILDKNVIEEGFCLRVDSYPRPKIYKIKSKNFILFESGKLDTDEITIEDEN